MTDFIVELMRRAADAQTDEPDENDKPMSPLQQEARAAHLKELFAAFQVKHKLEPGMMVRWKAGMKNRNFPRYGEPVVVMAINEGLVDTESKSGSPYFRESLGLSIGLIRPDGDFMTFHVDLARFEHYVSETL